MNALKRVVTGQHDVVLSVLQAASGLQGIGRAQAVAYTHGRGQLHHLAQKFHSDQVGAGKECVVAIQRSSVIVFHWPDPAFQPGQAAQRRTRSGVTILQRL